MEEFKIEDIQTNSEIRGQVLKLDRCAYVHVARQVGQFDFLEFAIPTPYVNFSQDPFPLSVSLQDQNEAWLMFMRKVTKKAGMQIMFSINLTAEDLHLQGLLENEVLRRLSQ